MKFDLFTPAPINIIVKKSCYGIKQKPVSPLYPFSPCGPIIPGGPSNPGGPGGPRGPGFP
jgi:hypothetical protein